MKRKTKLTLTAIALTVALAVTACSKTDEILYEPEPTITTTKAEEPEETTTAETTTADTTTTTTTAVEEITTTPAVTTTEATKVVETEPTPQQTESTVSSSTAVTTTTTAVTTTATAVTVPQVSTDTKNAQALAVAEEIADFVRETAGSEKSLRQISCAAAVVGQCYYRYCTYSDTDTDDWTAYGVFIAQKASCAGATKALGMVLDLLGYQWYHVNEHLYSHQWCHVSFSYSQQIMAKDGSIKTVQGTIVHADADAELIGIGGDFGSDAMLLGYNEFYEEQETGILREGNYTIYFN